MTPLEKQIPQELIQYVFMDFQNLYFNPNYQMEWAILAPKDEDVDGIDERLLSMVPGGLKIYLSVDLMPNHEYASGQEVLACLHPP